MPTFDQLLQENYRVVSSGIGAAFRELLERRHLYQSERVEILEEITESTKIAQGLDYDEVSIRNALRRVTKLPWAPLDRSNLEKPQTSLRLRLAFRRPT